MGTSIEMECNNCHFSFEAFLGIGFRFPQVYQDTINAAKEGKFGEIVQSFLLEHPDGALNCSMVLLQCTSCDELDKGRDLSMYIPKDKPAAHDGIWSVAFPYKNASYVAPRDLKDYGTMGTTLFVPYFTRQSLHPHNGLLNLARAERFSLLRRLRLSIL